MLILLLVDVCRARLPGQVSGAPLPPGFSATPQPLDLGTWRNKRVLAIGAHPDDIEYFAGGTLASLDLAERADGSTGANPLNVTLAHLVLTSGDAGGRCYDPATGDYRNTSEPGAIPCEHEELGYLRRAEMKAGGAALGARHVWRCGFGDGMLVSIMETVVRERVAAYVRHFRPHVVLTHYPYPNFEAPQTCNGGCGGADNPSRWDDLGYHPDHKRAGWHVLNTVYGGGGAADNDHTFHELVDAGGLAKWQPQQLWFFALTAAQPITHYVPLDESMLARKSAALAKHHSQYDAPPTEAVRWVGATVAAQAQALTPGGVQYAEGFQGFF